MRIALELDREAFGGKLGVHRGTVARWETGGAIPQPHYLDAIAERGGVEVGWLLHGQGDGPRERGRGKVERDERSERNERNENNASAPDAAGERNAALDALLDSADVLSSLERRLDRIDQLDEPEAMRILARDSVTAAYRTVALLAWGRAASFATRAAEADALGSRERRSETRSAQQPGYEFTELTESERRLVKLARELERQEHPPHEEGKKAAS